MPKLLAVVKTNIEKGSTGNQSSVVRRTGTYREGCEHESQFTLGNFQPKPVS
jgi:hypothetical protein